MKLSALLAIGALAVGSIAAVPAEAQRYGYHQHGRHDGFRGNGSPHRYGHDRGYGHGGRSYGYGFGGRSYGHGFGGRSYGYGFGGRSHYGPPRVNCRIVRGYYGPERRCFRSY